MPSHNKKFYRVQEKDYARLVAAGRAKGWIFGPGNLIRSETGLMARLSHDVSTSELSVELRELDKGTTPGSFFDNFWTTLQNVSEDASNKP